MNPIDDVRNILSQEDDNMMTFIHEEASMDNNYNDNDGDLNKMFKNMIEKIIDEKIKEYFIKKPDILIELLNNTIFMENLQKKVIESLSLEHNNQIKPIIKLHLKELLNFS